MSGSTHFQIYDKNLRRLMLLDWLHHEQIRRRTEQDADRWRRGRQIAPERPFWIVAADHMSMRG